MMKWIALFTGLMATTPLAAQDSNHFRPGETVTVHFSVDERSRQGGRLTPIFSKYRPDIILNSGNKVQCVFTIPQKGGLAPGTSGEIQMNCPTATRAGQPFEAYERGRLIGRGTVSPRR